MKIPFLELSRAHKEIDKELAVAYRRVMDSSWYILGNEVVSFEQEYAEYCGAHHCIGVANGLDALRLSLLAMGVGPGDEVIVPAHTFIATWLAVSQCGAKPIPVEPRLDTYNLDPDRIEQAISKQTRVIMPVHLYGQPADMGPILMLAKKHKLKVLEDAAQAHGALYNGKRIGASSDAVAWSFYPAKNLGALGDGGAVTTNDARLADRIRMLGNYGSREKYSHEIQGFNSRLDDLQAAFLRVKLQRLDRWNKRRREIANSYIAELQNHPSLTLPEVATFAEPVWHLFVIRHLQRDGLQKRLERRGVDCMVHYPVPPHRATAYARQQPFNSLPLTEQICREVLSIPMHPLMTDSQVEFVIDALTDEC